MLLSRSRRLLLELPVRPPLLPLGRSALVRWLSTFWNAHHVVLIRAGRSPVYSEATLAKRALKKAATPRESPNLIPSPSPGSSLHPSSRSPLLEPAILVSPHLAPSDCLSVVPLIPPAAVKKPSSGFIAFLSANDLHAKKGQSIAEVAKANGEKWKALSEEDKKVSHYARFSPVQFRRRDRQG